MTYRPDRQILNVIPHGLPSNRRGVLVDESGNNHNAIIKAPVLLLTDSDALDMEEFDWIDGNTNSRAVWVGKWFHNANSTSAGMFSQTFSGGGSQFHIYINGSNKLVMLIKGATGDAERTYTSTASISYNVWHSLIIEIDSGNDEMSVWLDGTDLDASTNPFSIPGGGITAFSADDPSTTRWATSSVAGVSWTGYVRWLGFKGTNVATTDEDALAFHNSPRTWLAGAGMAGYWPLNEGTNATFLDRTANDHPLAGTGVAWTIAQVPETGVNADTRMGIATTADGYIDLVTTDKVSQSAAPRSADTSSNDVTIIFVGNDFTGDFPVNTVVMSPLDLTWHRITVSSFGGGDTTLTVTPSPATSFTWDGQLIEAFKGQLQLLTEDAFAICMWWLPKIESSGTGRYMSVETDNFIGLRFTRNSAAGAYAFAGSGTSSLSTIVSGFTDGVRHSATLVCDNQDGSGAGDGWGSVDKTTDQDVLYDTLHGGQPDFIRLGARGYDAGIGLTDSFGPFCLIDLSGITGGVDQEVREGVRDAFHDADMDWEVFFADLLSKFDAWTGPSNGDTITITYWKLLNVVPYGQEIDTNDLIERHIRVLTRGSALPAESAADGTDSDTENCTGIPLKDLGDSFKGSGLWMDQAYVLDFGDHDDFSFGDGAGNDLPFSISIWTDAQSSPYLFLQKRASGQLEYSFVQDGNDKIYIRCFKQTNSNILIVAATAAIFWDGQTHHLVSTYDGSKAHANLKIYLDGIDVTDTTGETGDYQTQGMTGGTGILKTLQASRAHIYNVQLYNRELSANEVLSLYHNGAYR